MHYYQFNIGDYSKDAKHLTLEEDAIYRRLIDLYYLDEQPIQLDIKIVSRKILARGKEDIILDVLEEFFVCSDDCYTHQRIESDIAKYHAKSDKARASAKKRWEDNANAMRTHSEGNANHKPITNNHKPITKDQETIRETSVDISPATPAKKIPFKKIIEIYHNILPTLRRTEKLTKKREGYIRQRWNDDLPDLNHWENYFDFVSQSDFLMGRTESRNNRPPFRADLEWLTNPSNFVKVYEEKYHGKD